MAKNIMAQLRDKGSVTRGWLGVQIQALTPELRESLGLAAEGGALVAGVIKGDPAEKAGLKAGDVVVEFDGRAVRSDRDLVAIVGNTAVGRKVALKVVRDGKNLTIEVKVAKRSDDKDKAAAEDDDGPAVNETGKARIGVQVQDVTKELAEQLGLDDTAGRPGDRGARGQPRGARRHRTRRRHPRGEPPAGGKRGRVRPGRARGRAGQERAAARAQQPAARGTSRSRPRRRSRLSRAVAVRRRDGGVT